MRVEPMRGWRDIVRVFRRYFVATLIGFVAADAAIYFGIHGSNPVVMFPCVAVGAISSFYGIFGTIHRAVVIDDDGWPELPAAHCRDCERTAKRLRAVEADRDELRDALSTLRLPS